MFLENQINKMACVGIKTESINTEFQKLYMDYVHIQEVSIICCQIWRTSAEINFLNGVFQYLFSEWYRHTCLHSSTLI